MIKKTILFTLFAVSSLYAGGDEHSVDKCKREWEKAHALCNGSYDENDPNHKRANEKYKAMIAARYYACYHAEYIERHMREWQEAHALCRESYNENDPNHKRANEAYRALIGALNKELSEDRARQEEKARRTALENQRKTALAEERQRKQKLANECSPVVQKAVDQLDFAPLTAMLASPIHVEALYENFIDACISRYTVANPIFSNIVSVLEFLSANGLRIDKFNCTTNEYKLHKILSLTAARNKQLCYNLLSCLHGKLIFDKTCWTDILQIALSANHAPSVILACQKVPTEVAAPLLRKALDSSKPEIGATPLRIFIINFFEHNLAYAVAQYKLNTRRATLTRILNAGPRNSEHEAINIIQNQHQIIKMIVELCFPDKPKNIS